MPLRVGSLGPRSLMPACLPVPAGSPSPPPPPALMSVSDGGSGAGPSLVCTCSQSRGLDLWTEVTRAQQEQDRSCCSRRCRGPGGRQELRTDSNLSLFLILTYLLTENFAFIVFGRVIKQFYLNITVQKITIKYILKCKDKFAHCILQKVLLSVT